MELGTAVALTLNLLNEHNLLSQGWTVKIGRGARRLGLCSYRKKQIKLTRHHVMNGTDAEVMNTIRHEVAHALAGPFAKHGPEWKLWAIKLGADPHACTKKVSYDMPYRFILRCSVCQSVIQKRHNRVSGRRLERLYHAQCGTQSMGKLTLHRYTNES